LADNVPLPGAGQVIASDEIAGVQFQRVKTVWGGDGVATDVSLGNPLPVQAVGAIGLDTAIPAGNNTIGTVRRRYFAAQAATMARPADQTAYAAGDAVSNSATAASVTALSFAVSDTDDFPVAIERMRILSTDAGLADVEFRAWLFNADPTQASGVGGGDNAAFSQKMLGFIGAMTGSFVAMSDGCVAVLTPEKGNRIITTPVAGAKTVYALLETVDAFTPSDDSTTFAAALEGEQGGV
jgi:hypothetical protein